MNRIIALIIATVTVVCATAQTGATTAPPPKAKDYIIDDIGQHVPTLIGLTLNLLSASARHDWRDRLTLTLTSSIICEGTVFTLKHTIHSTRPDKTDRHSFPSGHTARAFRGAEMVRSEFGWSYGAGAYAIAVTVGALRIHHHRHRFGDVAAGAVIGVLSTRAAFLLLPIEKRIFGWDKQTIHAVALPTYSPDTRAIGLCASLTF